MEISPIQSLIDQGKFLEVIETINQLEKPNSEMILYKNIALAMHGDFKTAEQHAKKCLSDAKKLDDRRIEQGSEIVILLVKVLRGDHDTHIQLEICKKLFALVDNIELDYWTGFYYFVEGMFFFATIDLEALNEYRKRLKVVSRQLGWEFLRIYAEYVQCHITYASHTHDETIIKLHQIQKKATSNNFRVMEWYICGMISAFYVAKGEFEKFKEYAIKAKKVWNGDKLCIADIYYYGSLGLYYFNIADLDNSEMYYQKAVTYSETIGSKVSRGFQYRYLGEIAYRKGKLKEALEASLKGLQLQKEEKSIHGIGESHSHLGKIYQAFGDLEFALEHYLKGLDILKSIKYNPSIAESYDLIGNLYLGTNELNKAKEYFENSLELKRELDNPLSLVSSLFNLVRTYLQLNDQRVDSVFKEMETISRSVDNPQIVLYHKLAKALILKTSQRTRNQSQAQLILGEISEMPVIDHNLSVLALRELTDILLHELKISGNQEILVEIEETIEKLVNIAVDQNITSLLIRTYLYKARLSMLSFQLEEAKLLQVKAKDLADEKGLRYLSVIISNEMDDLAKQVNRWSELAPSTINLEQAIEFTQFEMILNRYDLAKQEIEIGKSVLLLILGKDGGALFSHKFIERDINEDMVGSFLTAIKRLGEQAFYEKGSIERIVHQNYTILVKLVGDFSFCFILEGSSYSTVEKFDAFIDTVQSTSLWQNFISNPTQLENDLFTALKRIAEELFSNEEETTIIEDEDRLQNEVYDDEPDYLVLPKELLAYKFLLNPIRLSIVKVLNTYFRYPAADLRKLLVIPWGTFNDHVNALSKKGFIESKREFLQENPRNILYITSSGVSEYLGVKSKLTSLLVS